LFLPHDRFLELHFFSQESYDTLILNHDNQIVNSFYCPAAFYYESKTIVERNRYIVLIKSRPVEMNRRFIKMSTYRPA
jgi:hypothetical protein